MFHRVKKAPCLGVSRYLGTLEKGISFASGQAWLKWQQVTDTASAAAGALRKSWISLVHGVFSKLVNENALGCQVGRWQPPEVRSQHTPFSRRRRLAETPNRHTRAGLLDRAA